jgi:hypothetical protein
VTTGQRPRERGTTTFWILGLCVMLFVLGGISLDLWRSFSERRALAADADAAALAGASIDEDVYRWTGSVVLAPAEAETRARASIARQLDRRALRSVDVFATRDTVTVVLHGHVDLSLLQLLHTADLEVQVTATATPRRSS